MQDHAHLPPPGRQPAVRAQMVWPVLAIAFASARLWPPQIGRSPREVQEGEPARLQEPWCRGDQEGVLHEAVAGDEHAVPVEEATTRLAREVPRWREGVPVGEARPQRPGREELEQPAGDAAGYGQLAAVSMSHNRAIHDLDSGTENEPCRAAPARHRGRPQEGRGEVRRPGREHPRGARRVLNQRAGVDGGGGLTHSR